VKSAHDRAFFRAQGMCGLTVGKADDVDRHERFTQRLADVLDRHVDGGGVEGLADRVAARRNLVDLITGRDGWRSGRPPGADLRVPEHQAQISQVVVATHRTGSPQNPLVSVLYEILGVLARPTQPTGGAVQGRQVRPKRFRVKPTSVAGGALGRAVVLIEDQIMCPDRSQPTLPGGDPSGGRPNSLSGAALDVSDDIARRRRAPRARPVRSESRVM
jgi:hypothetical protein